MTNSFTLMHSLLKDFFAYFGVWVRGHRGNCLAKNRCPKIMLMTAYAAVLCSVHLHLLLYFSNTRPGVVIDIQNTMGVQHTARCDAEGGGSVKDAVTIGRGSLDPRLAATASQLPNRACRDTQDSSTPLRLLEDDQCLLQALGSRSFVCSPPYWTSFQPSENQTYHHSWHPQPTIHYLLPIEF